MAFGNPAPICPNMLCSATAGVGLKLAMAISHSSGGAAVAWMGVVRQHTLLRRVLRRGFSEVGVVSPHLLGEIFRTILVNFSRFFPRPQSVLVNFSRFFPRLHSDLVSFSHLQSV